MIDTSDVRKMNMNAIRAVMWRGGEHTKQSIAADTGLSVATCNTLLNELERSGEVYSQKYQINGVGRSTSVYQINEDYESILCVRIDLDSEGNRLLLCDVLSMLRSTLYQEQTQFTVLDMDRVAGKITEMLEKFPNISCILVGTSGIIDHGVLRLSDIPELEEAHLLDALRTVAQQRPIYMTYDCQYRVYGAYKDAGYTSETLTLLFCMRNVLAGTASVIGGRIVSGKNGFAGMTGYMPWGMSQEEQIQVIAQGSPKGLELIVKTALSVIAVLNPAELLFAGDDILDVEELIVSLEGAFACGEGGVLLHVSGHALADGIAASGGVVQVGLGQPLVSSLEFVIEIVVLGSLRNRCKIHNERSFTCSKVISSISSIIIR